MNCGKLSFEVDPGGRRLIDISELERAFGLRPIGGNTESEQTSEEEEMRKAEEIIETERLKMRVRALEEQLDGAKDQLSDLKEQRDLWQKQAQQVLLTSQYSQKQAEELKEELEERKRREAERRQQIMEAKMKKLSGSPHNQNRPAAPVRERPSPSMTDRESDDTLDAATDESREESGNIEPLLYIRGLWRKIREKVA